jgi:hypothetical protein
MISTRGSNKKGARSRLPSKVSIGTCFIVKDCGGHPARQHAKRPAAATSIPPIRFCQAPRPIFLGARKIRPSLQADPLCAGSLVRVHQGAIVFVTNVGPEVIQQRFHK